MDVHIPIWNLLHAHLGPFCGHLHCVQGLADPSAHPPPPPLSAVQRVHASSPRALKRDAVVALIRRRRRLRVQ
jgi:hypothetical protein